MDLVTGWLNGPAGFVAWLTILVIIVGMVAASVGLLVVAGVAASS